MKSLSIKNLEKSYGTTKVISNISLDVREGEFCILLGPSGCGKTTILRIIAGLDQQDNGEVYIGDREVSDLTPKERDIAMVFQSYALYPHMSVYENMAFSLVMRKKDKKEINQKVQETAALLGLHKYLDRKPKELSGGQRQRVAIGRAIVRNPKLFLFDEPLSNLDAKLRSSMRVELARLHQKLKATTLYVTHDQVEAMTLGEKIVLLDQGIIQQVGSPDELYNNPVNLFVATFVGTPQINLVKGVVNQQTGKTVFRADTFTLDIDFIEGHNHLTGEEVTMAIRPEALTPADGPLRGNVELVEHLGSETIVYVTVNNVKLTSKAPPDFRCPPGKTISLALNPGGIYFFRNGLRVILP